MLSISKGLIRFYPEVNYDILTAGIIMHDIGKVYELDAQGITARYTTIGSLIGHIPIGLQILDRFGKDVLDKNDYFHIAHLILSHHGSKDLGSPVVPSTVEAIMLSNIDLLSSKARTAQKATDSITQGNEFSGFNQWLNGTRLWKQENAESEIDDKDLVNDDTGDQLSLG
ncbi:MAG: HD domain-containing protein [Chlorobiota bacterium]|nr:MAG: HD domain-containing protein [Chlorobiota bacterium]